MLIYRSNPKFEPDKPCKPSHDNPYPQASELKRNTGYGTLSLTAMDRMHDLGHHARLFDNSCKRHRGRWRVVR